MKKLFSAVILMVAFVATSNAGIVKLASKHAVVPAAKATAKVGKKAGKVGKATGKATFKASKATAKGVKKVVF